LEEINLTYLEPHERGARIGEIKEETFLDESTRENVPGTEVLDLNMAVDVKLNTFDQVNQAADCILDGINASVQGITGDQAKVNEHFNIDEDNLSNIQDKKEEPPKDTCIIPIMVEHDVGFLIPKKFFQKLKFIH